MDRLGQLPLVAQPGARFVCGYSTDLLGCIIERVSGQSLDAFFRDRIFRPLGMNDSWFFVPASERSRLATVYADGPGGLRRAPGGATGQYGWGAPMRPPTGQTRPSASSASS
ncbi:MAG: serine hydrolase domain-containing protein [Xanthomonadales bacterium]|nr:serine hydrolase domain-containing protein [Xanthomonadales bacterium]